MATKKPRITITITDHQHSVFRALSDATGQSMSSIIGEVIEASVPAFERLAAIAGQLRQQRTSEFDKMRSNLDKAQNELEPLAAIALNQLDMFLKSMEPPQTALDPRPVITGVTPPLTPYPFEGGKTSKRATGKASSAGSKK